MNFKVLFLTPQTVVTSEKILANFIDIFIMINLILDLTWGLASKKSMELQPTVRATHTQL